MISFQNRLTKTLGIEHPVLLAPMDVVSGGRLAAAVSNAGGLSLIGGGYGDRDWIQRETANAGQQRVGCGLTTWSLAKRFGVLGRVLSLEPVATQVLRLPRRCNNFTRDLPSRSVRP